MPLKMIRDNLVAVHADAIVNTANPKPVIGSGTDSAVYEAAGKEELLRERIKIGEIAEGDAAVTPAFGLHAKILIHTVSPVWIDGTHGETEKLASCYTVSLGLAEENGCESIAFPLLASGSNGFPNDIALRTALSSIQSWLMDHEMNVLLVVFDRASFALSSRLFSDVKEYIQEHQVEEAARKEYRADKMSHSRRRWKDIANFGFQTAPAMAMREETYEAAEPADRVVLPKKEETFQTRMFQLIDESGETDPAVYKRANIDRKLFAKIRRSENYRPSRKTAIALALALKLSLEDAADLIGRAGYALSMSTTADLILRFCFEEGIYDIMEVNRILLNFDQELL